MHLALVARTVSRAFDEALGEAGASLPVWVVLLTSKTHPRASQREMATAMGLSEATLTHHLNAMDADGLVVRRRDPDNRRVHVVELTDAGEELFTRLRNAAVAFDARLRRGLSDDEINAAYDVLDRLAGNVGASHPDASPYAGLVEPRRSEP